MTVLRRVRKTLKQVVSTWFGRESVRTGNLGCFGKALDQTALRVVCGNIMQAVKRGFEKRCTRGFLAGSGKC